MENKAYQNAWKDFIDNKIDIDKAKSQIGIDPKIISLYKEFVWNHYDGALEKMFPRLDTLIGIDWKDISQKYFAIYGPKAWDLNELCVEFPEFIINHFSNQVIEVEALSELSLYELKEFSVYKKIIKKRENSNVIKVSDTIELIEFSYDIPSWVKEMDELESGNKLEEITKTRPEKKSNILCISRNEDTNLCVFTNLGAIEIAVIEVIAQVNIIKGSEESILHFLSDLLPEELCQQINSGVLNSVIDHLRKQCIIY